MHTLGWTPTIIYVKCTAAHTCKAVIIESRSSFLPASMKTNLIILKKLLLSTINNGKYIVFGMIKVSIVESFFMNQTLSYVNLFKKNKHFLNFYRIMFEQSKLIAIYCLFCYLSKLTSGKCKIPFQINNWRQLH